MAIKIRLARGGSKKRPFYRIVAADSRMPRDGRFIERLGTYNPLLPKDSEERIKMDVERVQEWMAKGAKPTDRISRMLEAAGVLEAKTRNNPEKAQPGEKAAKRVAEKAAKAEAATEAAKEAAKEPEAAAEEPAAEEAAEEIAAEAPAEDAPSVEATAEEAPAEEAAAEEAPAEDPAAAEPAAEEAAAEDAPAEDAPAEEGEETKAG
ncbi:MAG: 30S ribosomal protein S16 [Paracoccaceae bacterium]|nr:30S ribosomal protein S16 [Paracoccaceae bacterium]